VWQAGRHRSISPAAARRAAASWYPWARYLYWHLSWTKADGARLDTLARFKQNYESGSGWNDPGAASLVRLDIHLHP
jgi:hypothetical protein